MEISQRKSIFVIWFWWQFYEVPKFLLQVWKNYLMFAENYFSVLLLLKTLFAPWRGYHWQNSKKFDVYEFFLNLSSNIFSRFLGTFMRIVLIIAGIVAYALVGIIGFATLLAWVLMPFFVFLGFYFLVTL